MTDQGRAHCWLPVGVLSLLALRSLAALHAGVKMCSCRKNGAASLHALRKLHLGLQEDGGCWPSRGLPDCLLLTVNRLSMGRISADLLGREGSDPKPADLDMTRPSLSSGSFCRAVGYS